MYSVIMTLGMTCDMRVLRGVRIGPTAISRDSISRHSSDALL